MVHGDFGEPRVGGRPVGRRMALAVAGLVLLGSLAGCQTGGLSFGSLSSSAPPAPLPTYRVGDEFRFVNDRGEPVLRRVAAVRGDFVDWRTETAYRYTAYRNFALPRVRWDGVHSRGNALTGLPANLLWPLADGNEESLAVRYKRFDKRKNATKEYEQRWVCKVRAPRSVTVPAGTFDAYKITCKEKSRKGRTDRVRQWFYAPSVGYFVRRVKRYRDGAELSMDLVSVKTTTAPRR